MNVRKTVFGSLASACLVMASAGAAGASETIDVTIDFAKIIKLGTPASTIVIGNPGIADATVQDKDTVVLTGRSAGTTNMIVLGPDGKEVANAVIRVSSDIQQLTTIFYGSSRQTFSCAPTCEQVISVGDSEDAFTRATSQIQTRTSFASGK